MPSRRNARWILVTLTGCVIVLAPGCASAPSPMQTAIERKDGAAAPDGRMAPMAAKRRGLLIAGDGYGRMAYLSDEPTATASVDSE